MGSSGRPPLCTPPDIFPAPALSLSLVAPFGRNDAAATHGDETKDRDEGAHGGIRGDGLRPSKAADTSNNMGQGSQSAGAWSEQIRVLEAAFEKCPHPDEKQRQQLSEQLGFSALQVKFWFHNRRSQIKTIQERDEKLLLELRKQNRVLQESTKKLEHLGCLTRSIIAATNTEKQMLRLENAKLKSEVERLRRALGNNAAAAMPSCSTGGFRIRSRYSLYDYIDVGHDNKTKFLDLAGRALDELTAMCSSGQPLWARGVETGRDVLNYDEYARLFRHHDDDDSGDRQAVWSVEASRETGIVYCNATQLVHAFVDVNQWKEMFPSIITKASTLEVIHAGENDHGDGIVQLMSAEVQTLTPGIPTRELHFLRHCKKLGAERWAIVDVSLDNFEPGAQTSSMCWKKPSGCIVEEQSLGRCCKVTWVEHVKCRNAAVLSAYRTLTASGLAFGARRWVAALRLQCERMVFSVATNIPTKGSNGVDTLSGRQSVLKLAQRMTSSLYRIISASRSMDPAWTKASNQDGTRDIRLRSRKSAGEHGEPQGRIACAVLTVWMPVSPAAVFGFLLDESRRHEWDLLLLPGQSVQSYVTVRKGDDRGNCVTAYAAKSSAEELSGSKWIIQDSSRSPCESTVVYVPVDAAVLRPVIDGHDSSAVAVLPCGFVVVPGPGGREARPAAVIASRKGKEEERTAVESAGSLVTVAFQALASSSATDAPLAKDVVDVARLASCTLDNIKKALRRGDC